MVGPVTTIALIRLFALATVLGGWGVTALAVWWYILQPPPLTVHEIWTETPIVHAGGDLLVRFTSSKDRDCPVSSEYVVIGGRGVIWTLDGVEGFGPVGDPFTLGYTVHLPLAIGPGAATFRERVTYDCGLGRTFVVVTPDVHFEVIP